MSILARGSSTRIAAAFLLAPVVAAFLLACPFLLPNASKSFLDRLSLALALGMFFAGYAYISAIMFGLPIFYIVKRRIALTPSICIVAGAITAPLPILALELAIAIHDSKVPGWHTNAMPAWLALPGALGGIIFWTIGFAGIGARSDHTDDANA